MSQSEQSERADAFHRLHAGDRALVMVNAWDAVSARIIEQAGAPAIATTSAGVAWSLGYSDGEQLNRDELVAACARICRVVKVPVSVDLERGYGRTPAEAAATVRALLDAGAVGINIEDGITPEAGLAPPAILAEKIGAIRAAGEEAGVPLFINARTDTYFMPTEDPVARLQETLRRARIYVEAGADGIFVPGIESLEEMAQITQAIPRPLNIYAGYAGPPPVEALWSAGVRRVSLGCGPFQAALALVRRIATETLRSGTYATMTADLISHRELNGLFPEAGKNAS
jgi:2-methylisocitrate lyase-like PEP mutase family enzyme